MAVIWAHVDFMQSPVSMLMSSDDLVVAERSHTLLEIWELMVESSIQHIPIVEGDELVGLLSSWDIARYAVDNGSAALGAILAGDAMERNLVRLHPKATLREAADKLADGGFHALPVADDDNALVGILTSTDIIRYVATGRLRDE